MSNVDPPHLLSGRTGPREYRRAIPWVMGVLYALVTLIAAYYVFELRDSQRAQVVEQLETQIQDQIAVWEDALLGTLAEWMDIAVSTHERAALRQVQMRGREPWFNALYIWTHAGDPRGRRATPTFLFPPPPVVETESLTARPCLAVARQMQTDPALTAAARADAYVRGCARERLAVRLYAASEAANILKDNGMIEEALGVIESVGLPENLTLAAAAQDGISPFRVFLNRLQRANYTVALGRKDEAFEMLYQLGIETANLDAPEAADLIQLARYGILRELRRNKLTEEAKRLDLVLSKVERRVAAFEEIQDRILQRTGTTNATEAPRFIYDQYSETPFLLFYGWSPGGDYGVALQLEQTVLLNDFLAVKSLARLKKYLVVTDAAGNVLASGGARKTDGDIALHVTFPRTLTHLRVGLRDEAISTRLERIRSAWITPLVIVVLCGLLGAVALAVQVRANRQQLVLLKRQREFTTRVTHELKTPLAGIRVMAENLEAGAFRDGVQLREMAARIVEETDRLTARVDEVLAVARDRALPNPEPFDPEEAVLEAIDQWGPRLEQAGIALHADLHPTDEVQGDLRAVRDAISCLLDNALKYRRDDRNDAEVWLTLEQEGDRVVVTVTDNGIGVPPGMREAIFERFVRVEGPNRGKSGGHGLGLAQVATIVQAHGGDVRCTEGVDGGARFVLRLPALAG